MEIFQNYNGTDAVELEIKELATQIECHGIIQENLDKLSVFNRNAWLKITSEHNAAFPKKATIKGVQPINLKLKEIYLLFKNTNQKIKEALCQ